MEPNIKDVTLLQLPMSDKGLKRLCESFKLYKHALHDEEVAAAITGIFAKAKKGSAKAEVKVGILEYVSDSSGASLWFTGQWCTITISRCPV